MKHSAFHILTTVHDGYLFISGDLMKPRPWMLSIGKNVVMGPHDNILSGLAALFASFYNLNLQYPEDSSCTLEFIQRYRQMGEIGHKLNHISKIQLPLQFSCVPSFRTDGDTNFAEARS
uniref:Uncharacterized protein n=1 Tax=Seriola dumerili TaxID=41447 RepID=A0A3B4UWU4_SERDU